VHPLRGPVLPDKRYKNRSYQRFPEKRQSPISFKFFTRKNAGAMLRHFFKAQR
jgi:hypothetical protein